MAKTCTNSPGSNFHLTKASATISYTLQYTTTLFPPLSKLISTVAPHASDELAEHDGDGDAKNIKLMAPGVRLITARNYAIKSDCRDRCYFFRLAAAAAAAAPAVSKADIKTKWRLIDTPCAFNSSRLGDHSTRNWGSVFFFWLSFSYGTCNRLGSDGCKF